VTVPGYGKATGRRRFLAQRTDNVPVQ
jgi:hypothetical protein